MAGKRKAAATKPAGARKGGPPTEVQEALQVTWLLKGDLKNAQLAYLRVCVRFARVRDNKLYAALHHPDLESYAAERLHLGRSSLYRYLQIHGWVSQFHKEWLEPKPKGEIPDLSDIADLIFIEKELARPDLDAATRAALETLKGKALNGTLKRKDIAPFRRVNPARDWRKGYLSLLRRARNKGQRLQGMPAEVLDSLNRAIDVLSHATILTMAGHAEKNEKGTTRQAG